jgi:hypothetical protein
MDGGAVDHQTRYRKTSVSCRRTALRCMDPRPLRTVYRLVGSHTEAEAERVETRGRRETETPRTEAAAAALRV